MLRTKLAKNVLTKKEQKHLTADAGIHTMAQMQRQVDFIKFSRKARGLVCFDCKHIAKKLGML